MNKEQRDIKSLVAGYGCEVSPSLRGCLTCPLPACRHDDPDAYDEYMNRERDAQIYQLRMIDGLHNPEIAARFDLSIRTVGRVVKKQMRKIGQTT